MWLKIFGRRGGAVGCGEEQGGGGGVRNQGGWGDGVYTPLTVVDFFTVNQKHRKQTKPVISQQNKKCLEI